MLNRIIGRARSGKTGSLLTFLQEKLNDGFECVLLVPEQQSVQTERKLCELLGDGYNLSCEVLNFERLPNRVCREYGGLAAEILDEGASEAIMSLCIERLADRLKVFGKCDLSADFIKKMTSSISDLNDAGVSSGILSFFASKAQGSSLGDKLSDLALISAEYQSCFGSDRTNRQTALEKLAGDLKQMPFFKDKAVFIDGYFDFSEPEYAILKEIIKQSHETYITVFADENDETGLFDIGQKTAAALKKLAEGKVNDIYSRGEDNGQTETLRLMEKNFYKVISEKLPCDGSFSVIECSDPFEEAEAAAAKITRLTKRGLRYREICVAVRSTEDYEGIIDLVFEKYGIPFYFAEKDNAGEKSICTLISAIFETASTDFSIPAVKKYLGSGFSSLSIKEADALESYIETWRIRSHKRYEEEWVMNPDGYKKDLSDRDAFTLNTVNHAKKKLTSSLMPLYETLIRKDITVKEALTAVFEHLKEIGADRRLKQRAANAEASGYDDERNKLSMLWDSITKSFETLVSICGDEHFSPSRTGELLSLILGTQKLGSIPVSLDGVNIGGASLMRPDNCKAMIVLGVNEGVFPAQPVQSGLFTLSEAKELLGFGLDIRAMPSDLTKKENFLFYYICCSPSDDLTLIYRKSDLAGEEFRISSAALYIASLFDVEPVKFGGADRLFCKKALLESLPSLSSSDAEAIKSRYRDDAELKEALEFSARKTADATAVISFAERRKLYLSFSRLETYRKCPFSYFSRYILGLKEPKEADFSSLETGNFFHEILETFIKNHSSDGRFVPASDEELKKEADEYVNEYVLSICKARTNVTPSLRYTLSKLKRSVFLLFKNISDEFALCSFFPYRTEEPVEAEYAGENGTKIALKGNIDRIDLLKKGGKTYVRIIDYKTGTKKFDMDAVENGLDMQMLIYLFAYIDGQRKSDPSTEYVPAGLLYMPVFLKSADSEFDSADINEKFKRTGLILNDREIIEEMEHGVAGIFIPVKAKKDEGYYSFSSLAALETFGKLKEDITERIIDIGTALQSGDMNARPFRFKGRSPCSYCEMKAFCRVCGRKELSE